MLKSQSSRQARLDDGLNSANLHGTMTSVAVPGMDSSPSVLGAPMFLPFAQNHKYVDILLSLGAKLPTVSFHRNLHDAQVTIDLDLNRVEYATLMRTGGALDLRFVKGEKTAESFGLKERDKYLAIAARPPGSFLVIPLPKVVTETTLQRALDEIDVARFADIDTILRLIQESERRCCSLPK